MLRTDELLLRARKRVSRSTYKMVHPTSGCTGTAVRSAPGRRCNITIRHTAKCRCLDMHMIHIRKHAQVMYQRNGIKRLRRDDLIIAIKLRLPDVGFRVRWPQPRKPVDPKEAGEPTRVVEETPGGQRMVEEWDSVEAWRTRKIWKDW
ncbi:hypothetical protein F4819DRAFT_491639 [Hypoxylon fuscum]|nr:hypothetical protein F4819DRAFT_491639 [Hypoxylon fuscum]